MVDESISEVCLDFFNIYLEMLRFVAYKFLFKHLGAEIALFYTCKMLN